MITDNEENIVDFPNIHVGIRGTGYLSPIGMRGTIMKRIQY